MKDFKRIMIGLDFTEMDRILIKYLAFICQSHRPEKMYFFHTSKNLTIEKELQEKFPELMVPRDEKLTEEMKENVATHFPNVDEFDVEYIVNEGAPLAKILHWSEIKLIDLIVMGRKMELKGSGVLPQNISRKINCSLLFVNEKPNYKFDKIFVPGDFSENSNMALKKALDIAEANPGAQIYYNHIYGLPDGFYKTGKSEEEFIQIMKGNAIKKFNKIMDEKGYFDKPINPSFTFDNGEDHAKLIYEKATELEADIIIIGAKGRTFATAMLLGSVTEKVLGQNGDIVTLVVKKKNENLNILDWIKIV